MQNDKDTLIVAKLTIIMSIHKEKALELKDKIRAKQSQIEGFIQEVEVRFSSLEGNVQSLKEDLISQLLKSTK